MASPPNSRSGSTSTPTADLPEGYSFFAEAAAKAREESRNYWAGKPSYPVKGWYIPLEDSLEARLKRAIARNKGETRD